MKNRITAALCSLLLVLAFAAGLSASAAAVTVKVDVQEANWSELTKFADVGFEGADSFRVPVPEDQTTLMYTAGEYADATFQFKVKFRDITKEKGVSFFRIYVRDAQPGYNEWEARDSCYVFLITVGNDDNYVFSVARKVAGRTTASVADATGEMWFPIPASQLKEGAWYSLAATVETVADGVHLKLTMDGKTMVDVVDTDPKPVTKAGAFGLMNSGVEYVFLRQDGTPGPSIDKDATTASAETGSTTASRPVTAGSSSVPTSAHETTVTDRSGTTTTGAAGTTVSADESASTSGSTGSDASGETGSGMTDSPHGETTAVSGKPEQKGDSGFPGWAIAVIVIAVVVLGGGAAAAVWYLKGRKAP